MTNIVIHVEHNKEIFPYQCDGGILMQEAITKPNIQKTKIITVLY